MKKHIFIMTLFALCLHLNQAHAQRYLPGMKALQVTAGMADGATLLDKDCFIYGGVLTLELETYLTDWVVLLVNARERMLFGSDIGKFHTQVGMGLKFIIN